MHDIGPFLHPYLKGNMLYLRRILINILNNAVKYTPDDGTITLRAKETGLEDDKAVFTIEVTDNGIGMDEAFLDRLFEPFTQAQTGSRSDYAGTGLGMAISKRLAEHIGATLEAQSIPGKGSTFTLCVPLGISEEVQTRPAPKPKPMHNLDNIRVLLAEDNELNREIATELLEQAGAQVTKAENGEAVIETYVQSMDAYDVILMDVMMPKLDGLEATKRIRKLEQEISHARIPIIAMTANVFEEDIQACLAAGMDGHVGKPINLQTLLDTIAQFTKEK